MLPVPSHYSLVNIAKLEYHLKAEPESLLRSGLDGGETMARTIRAPRGTQLTCKNWLIEAAYRMIQNNLDPQVAGDPEHLIVYGGRGKAARNWECFDAILEALRDLEPDETLLVQSGKPVGVFRTHPYSPRVLIASQPKTCTTTPRARKVS